MTHAPRPKVKLEFNVSPHPDAKAQALIEQIGKLRAALKEAEAALKERLAELYGPDPG